MTFTTKFTEKKRGLRHMQKSVENLCLVSHPRFISSTAAAESLVLHAFTGSRAACDVYSRSNASGGHTHMTNLIDSIATVSPEFPTGDIFVAFDNQQVIGREYRVSAGGRQRISVATTISVFQEALPVNVQSKFPLNTKLPIPSSDPAALWSIFSKEEDKWKAVHRSYRNKWIEKRLEIVKSEIALGNGDLQNSSIQTHIRSAEYESGLEYSRVPAGSSSCAAVDMESLLVNPNSTATVTQVLDKLLELNERSDPNRKWFSVYCDGLPYGIAWKLIQFTYICSACKKTGSEAELRVHECGFNLCTRKYAKFNLQFGAGHGEINLVRTVFKENFGIFIRPIAQKLGFVSPKSLEYCKSAHDHHKSWQILQIIYVALSDEIMNLYNKDNPNTDFSVSSFSEWKQKQTNPNLSLAFDFVFNVLHPIFLFRAAIRQCNDNVAYSALYQASSLFFGFNHPKYRDIIAKQIFMGICSPSEGSPTSRKLAFRMNGSQFGQGLDFLLEERNKAQKNWVFSHGPPTHNQWKRASSSLSYFESIGEQVKDNLEWSIDNNNRWRQKFGDEYILARQHFREILSELPPTLHAFTKEREPLNPKFVNSMAICAENKITYLKAFISGKKCVLNVVSAEDMHAKSSEELKKLAKRQLRQLPASTKADLESQLSKAVDVDDILEIIGSIEYLVEELDSPITTF
ncbi:unnamed protein product [Orchesella dallaii]|uniref:Uncharacterized protein n=1 Tax=Orchesella dallaii TaxID=48710 RepID=A0ABP1Q771_9HEXA